VTCPLYSILIPTLASRRQKLRLLLDVLLPQVEGQAGCVEIVALHNNGEKSLAEYRQALLEDARGAWLSFVDDDDMVADDFVPSITEALVSQDPDFVAFRALLYSDGARRGPECRTGIQYGSWHDTAEAYIRDVTHLNPVRATIAKQADFRTESAGAEDWSYVSQVRPLLRTQAVVNKILYHYYHSSGDSAQHGLAPHTFSPRLEVSSPAFRWHPWSTAR
jgi:Glycosyl transferase family 2